VFGPELIGGAHWAALGRAELVAVHRDDERLDGLADRRQGDLGIGPAGGAGVGQPGDIVPGLLAKRLQQRPQVLRAAARGHRLGAHAGPRLEVAPLQVRGTRVRLVPQAGELGR
jgi:hypothetical protein